MLYTLYIYGIFGLFFFFSPWDRGYEFTASLAKQAHYCLSHAFSPYFQSCT
jgi:hypothetical protein